MKRAIGVLFILASVAVAQTALTGQGGAFDVAGNNTASVSLSPQNANPGPDCSCAPITVTVSYNSADGSTAVTVNSSTYKPGSGSISEVVTSTNASGTRSSGTLSLGGNTTPDSRGNVSGRSNGEAVGALVAGTGTTAISTKITYTFETKVGDCVCKYAVEINVVQAPASGQATSASAQSVY